MIEQIDDSLEIVGSNSFKEFSRRQDEFLAKVSEAKLLVFAYELPGCGQLLHVLEKNNIHISTVVTFKDDQLLEEYKRAENYHSHIELFSYASSPFNFSSSVEKLFKFQSRRHGATEKYMQIKVEYFNLLDEAVADIYIRLNEHKFVKILRRFEQYTIEDIKRYQAKSVEHFYIKTSDYQNFMQQVIKLKMRDAEEMLVVQKDSALVPAKCHEAVFEMVNSIGLDQASVRLAAQSLNKTVELIEKSTLTKLLAELLQNNSYISEHSMMVSFLSGAICRNSDWYSQDNIMRLSIAAFFHDIKCTDERVAKISTMGDYEIKSFNNTQLQMLENHPIEAANIVKQLGGVPHGVEKIIINHHERYDGTGFPRKLDYRSIDPLTAIFIVSHEMVDLFYNVGFYRDNILETLTDMKERYDKGAFPKVVNGLIMSLGAGNYFE